MDKIERIPTGDLSYWRDRLLTSPPSCVLEDISRKYNIGKSELAIMLEDLYCEVDLPQVQAIWHWDINKSGKGLDDREIDEIIGKLRLRE
jgi:hypothetical protein